MLLCQDFKGLNLLEVIEQRKDMEETEALMVDLTWDQILVLEWDLQNKRALEENQHLNFLIHNREKLNLRNNRWMK